MVPTFDIKTVLAKTGIIGYGVSGRIFHAPFIKASHALKLEAIASRKSDVILREYPYVRIHETPEALIFDSEISAVIIASPNTAHFEQAKLALEQKKHVVIDKPFTLNYRDTCELFLLAEKNKCMITAYQNRRWDSDFLTIKKVLDDGLLGDILYVESNFTHLKPVNDKWKENPNDAGAGILLDIAPHLIDQVVCLFGEPQSLDVDTAILRKSARVTDYFQLTLTYPTKKVILKANHISYAETHRFLIHGTEGSLVCSGKENQESLIRAGCYPGTASWKPGQNTTISLHKEGCHKKISIILGDYTTFYNQFGIAISANNTDYLPISATEVKLISKLLDRACQQL